jgi:hypothetical protein
MRAATLDQPSKDTAPVFVAGGRHRSHAVRLAAIALGLLLAGWLAAIAAGLIGFSSLPELTLSRPGGAGTAPAPSHHVTRTMDHDAGGAQASPAASRAARGSGQTSGASSTDPASRSGETQEAGRQGGSVGGGPPSPGGVSAAPQPHPTSPPGGAAAPDKPGQPPSFTPRASGEQAANPPRGSSSSAPRRTISADPPGKATGSPSG